MAWYMWVLIILAVVSYHQYMEPEKTNKLLEPVWGTISGFIKDFNLFDVFSFATPDDDECPDVDEPVCAGGQTYANSCEAGLEGHTSVVAGAC